MNVKEKEVAMKKERQETAEKHGLCLRFVSSLPGFRLNQEKSSLKSLCFSEFKLPWKLSYVTQRR